MHEPVMLTEVLDYLGLQALLNTQANIKVIDATVGGGGYTLALCKLGADILGIDQDKSMLEIARNRLETACLRRQACPPTNYNVCGSFSLVQGNFSDIEVISQKHNFTDVDAIVFDLGVASQQLISPTRGLSFQFPDAPLDMRLNSDTGVKAADLLNALDKRNLTKMFERTCDYSQSRKLAQRVLKHRAEKPFVTVADFLNITKGLFKPGKIHPATKPLLALRIAVNSELENLDEGLTKGIRLLNRSGVMVVVSFHSLEDAIVKNSFKEFESKGLGKVLTDKPVTPSVAEINKNNRARSAKLRAFRKI